MEEREDRRGLYHKGRKVLKSSKAEPLGNKCLMREMHRARDRRKSVRLANEMLTVFWRAKCRIVFLTSDFAALSLKFHGRPLERHSSMLQLAALANLLVLFVLLR